MIVLFCFSLLGQGNTRVEFEQEEVEIERSERFNSSPCTQYTTPGSTVDLWDWRTPTYEVVFYQDNQAAPTSRTIDSPFFTPGTNINHLGFQRGNEGADFEPADGWELLYLNMGTPERPVQEPSFGLYNRLDGRVRILFYIEPNDGGSPNNVLIRLSNVQSRNIPNTTALFETLNVPANALSDFDKNVSLGGVVQLNEGEAGLEWYLLESVVGYDPCACQYESSIEVEPILRDITSLSFFMDGTGTSEAIYEPKDPFSALGYVNGLSGTISSGLKKYKDGTSYKVDAEPNKDQTIKILSNVVGGFFGGTTAITDLLGFITGKKSGSGAPKLTGFNHNFNFMANGGLLDNNTYDTHFFYTPGSFYNENQLNAFRPIYDNPLGIFAVLEPPVVEMQEELSIIEGDAPYYEVTEKNTIRWRFAGDLQYHINTIAGISNRPVELMASLVWTDCNNSDNFFATPAINITCFEDYVVEFEDIYESVIDPGTGEQYDNDALNGCDSAPQLQIVAVLTSAAPNSGQEILFSARYRTTTREVATGTIGENPFENMTLEEINNTCSNEFPRPVADLSLSQFCERRYNPVLSKSQFESSNNQTEYASDNDQVVKDLAVFPNPFGKELNISLGKHQIGQSIQFDLYDILGELVWTRQDDISTAGQYSISNSFGSLAPGTYLLMISGDTFTESVKIQKR
jgi:hypothetical protein